MLYCPNCQILCTDGKKCPLCGKKKLREVKPSDPVLLITTGESKCDEIAAALDDNKIPHEERINGLGIPSSVYGKSSNISKNVFVSYGELEHSKEILRNIGALIETEHEEGQTKPLNENKEEDFAPMGRTKRIFARIVSAILFIILIWGVVTAADNIADAVKSLLGFK